MQTHANGWTAAQLPIGPLVPSSQTLVHSVFATCEGEAARRQRGLDLLAQQAGAREAWLFTMGSDREIVLAARLGVVEPPVDLLPLVSTLFEEAADVTQDTTATPSIANDAAVPCTPREASITSYYLLPLTVARGDGRVLVGAAAVPATGTSSSIDYNLLDEIATQLFGAGDLATVRAYC